VQVVPVLLGLGSGALAMSCRACNRQGGQDRHMNLMRKGLALKSCEMDDSYMCLAFKAWWSLMDASVKNVAGK
jgi:hypothetical protein